ncbi:hypothetical protein DPMN_124827 [Dreissena polymorpha]|uniref:Uncharacterized protein n=1 Tax=Dreissena polymorpha TaxID=45954 RepID=A0A9D4GU94_DREPO|nr:hypothetical protein DPMN_124827 [Dreissena polymorpha]
MTFIHSSRYVQLVPIPSYPVSDRAVLSQFDYVRTHFFFVRCAVVTHSKAVLTPSYYVLKRDDRKKILSRLKVLKHLSRSAPFQGVNKVRRQFVTRCFYEHSVLTQFEPV